MSNVQSYNALIDRFKAFASGHFILKTFSHGQIDTADLEKFTEYPFMHVVPSNVTYAKGTKTFSFQIVLADLPRDKDDKVEFQKEVLSDLQRIAEDLVAEITNHRMLFGDLITVQNVTLEPFLEEFHNTLTGWTVSLELLVPYYWDACSIPAEWNDFFESGSGGTGSILTFIDSITRDNNGNVSLVNDEATPAPNYYYGTNDEGVRGWYLTTDNIGLTCETIGDCQTIIDIEAAIDALEEEIVLKADITSISAVGFSNDYTDLDNLPTLPTGTVTSVGLTMPSAFSVANSPITSSGDIAVTGAGTVSQYVRGDGSLANFPSSTGGGSSLTFYLNGSVAQGTFGGVAFKEMDRVPVLGAGTDFTIATNGYIQSFITDANVPNLLEIPAGNWNFETYFSASSNGGNPSFYIELYKWNGTTLSLIASNSANPEGITNGTAIDLYLSAIAVPQTTLALTDRLAVRIYVNNSGRTIKLHTENGHLCEVITTFSTGLTALNGLTAQVQNFATGTAGTDFGISSATSTHTFNLPTASATNRGALSSADWTTFNNKQAALVSGTNIKTINSTTLLGSGDIAVQPTLVSATNIKTINGNSVLGSGDLVVGGTTTLAIGTTPITSGTVGRVLFEGTGNVLQESANLFWDNTNSRLGIGTASPATPLQINGNITIGSTSTLWRISTDVVGSGGNPGGYLNWMYNDNFIYYRQYNQSAFHNYETTGGSSYGHRFISQGTVSLTIRSNGNVLIGTTTDAGYKLDVVGNARISNYLYATWVVSSNVGVDTGAALNFAGGSITSYRNNNFNHTTGANTFLVLNIPFTPTSGTGIYNVMQITPTINQTGGANGISRGLYIAPTLTAAADFRAIETTVGNVMLNTTSGNTLIGTTTNAGFKLDVNGSGRISGPLSAAGGSATGGGSVSIGTLSSTGGNSFSAAIGYNAQATNNHAIAIGYNASASANSSYAFGYAASASGQYSTAFSGSSAFGQYSVAWGNGTSAGGIGSMSGGRASLTYLNNQFALGSNMSYKGDSQTSLYNGSLNTGIVNSGGTYSFDGIRPSNSAFTAGVTQIWYVECVVVFAVKGKTAAITEFALRDTFTIRYKLAVKSTDGIGTSIIGTPVADSLFSDASLSTTSVTFSIVSNNLVVNVTPPIWASGGQMQFRGTASFQLSELGVYSQSF